MHRVQVAEDDETRVAEVTLSFNSDDIDDVARAATLLEVSRGMVPTGGRLAIEIDAHIAYFRALETGLRAVWSPKRSSDADE